MLSLKIMSVSKQSENGKNSNKEQAHTQINAQLKKPYYIIFTLFPGSMSTQYAIVSLWISASQRDRQVSVVRFTRKRCGIAEVWVSAHEPCWDY